jgi:hypothetical protein
MRLPFPWSAEARKSPSRQKEIRYRARCEQRHKSEVRAAAVVLDDDSEQHRSGSDSCVKCKDDAPECRTAPARVDFEFWGLATQPRNPAEPLLPCHLQGSTGHRRISRLSSLSPTFYSGRVAPRPMSRAALYIAGATAMSSSARPRLMAIVRSSADCLPGLRPVTISPRSA